VFSLKRLLVSYSNKKAVLLQGNRAMPQLFFSVKVIQGHVFWSQWKGDEGLSNTKY